nr:hypothetical protein [uncultured Duganella sp.]
MKSVYPRAGLALLCAVVLSACGGGNDGNLQLAGSISGLSKPGLVLINKNTGEKLTVASGATSFLFTRYLATDENFNVDIDTQPTGAKCTASENINKANVYTSIRVQISCQVNPWVLGGVVKGLADDGVAGNTDGVTLANGPDTVYVAPSTTAGADVPFSFASFVGDGSPFGVTVLAQPASRTCTVAAPSTGLMPSGNYDKLVITCVAK